VRFRFQLLKDFPPGIVLLSTDGYSNSFATADDFLRVGSDYMQAIRTEGAEAVEKKLPAWLQEASREGSGDDITVGIIYRCEPPLKAPTVHVVKGIGTAALPSDGRELSDKESGQGQDDSKSTRSYDA
jgi:hypothetical protein